MAGHVIKELQWDGDLEFDNFEVRSILQQKRIRMTMPYTSEQNGTAERENRILVESERSMLHTKDLLWAEAVNTATYVLNRNDPTSVKEKTSFEL